jgi:hypothetical protein
MGLERVAAILQGKLSNYECDLLRPIIHHAASLFRKGLRRRRADDRRLRINADHARAAAFPDPRWRGARQRRPRLRAAQDHAPRPAQRPPIGVTTRFCTSSPGSSPSS